ncbi:MAG: hypothetical protein ACI38R_22650 [Rhodococcus sp. (in: high G+C Gram-positive bacteria)]
MRSTSRPVSCPRQSKQKGNRVATNREQDVLDAIDALVDEQMAGGEPIGGYDYGDPDYPSCPHCSRGWHGLAITQRIERMRWTGEMDEDYRYAEDDSPVLCPGSEFIGPVATPDQLHWIRLDDDTKRRFPHGYIPSVNEMILAEMQIGDLYGDLSAHRPYSLPEIEFPEPQFAVWSGGNIPDWIEQVQLWPNPMITGYRDDVIVDPMRSATNRLEALQEQLVEIGRDAGLTLTAGRWLPAETTAPAPDQAVETPQQRALPRPSTTPPMWANDPARTRRTRNRSRNIRTPRV